MVIEIKAIREIPFLTNYVKAKPLRSGYSDDIKYLVWCNDNKYLLKLGNKDTLLSKKNEYKNVRKIGKCKVAKPLSVGETSEYSYIIYPFIDGVEANIGVKKLTPVAQYQTGLISGSTLKVIHYPANSDISYKDHFLKKVNKIKEMEIEVPFLDKLITLFNTLIDDALEEEFVFCHGDYHTGNMIVSDDIYTIDFNRSKIGPKYLDFKRLFSFSRAVSIPFCRGQLEGYFGRTIVEEDFKKMIPFLIMEILGFYICDVDGTLKALVDMILEDFDNFNSLVPLWY